jgi:hypothetical protein
MARRGSGSGGKKPNRRNLDKKNVRRQSNPKTPEEKKKAIGDDLESEIRGYLPQMIMESELRQRDMAEVLGVGGPSLSLFVDEFESGYSGATGEPASQPYDLDKEQRPDLKLDSREAVVPWGVADDANFEGSPDKSTSKKPPTKKPRRK